MSALRPLSPQRVNESVHITSRHGLLNPLESRGNYSATSNIQFGTLAVDGWAVTFGTVMKGLGGAAARPGPSSLYQM